jgi:hypothetical protein
MRGSDPASRRLSSRLSWSGTGASVLLAIVVAVSAAYYPARRGAARRCGDDDGHITKPELQSVDGLRRIWLEPGATQQYYPVLHSAFWFEHRVWKDAPFGYHLTNIVLHSIAAFLIFLLLRELGVLAPCWRGYVLSYVVSPDGQRFLINTVIEQPATAPITVILNWKPGR